MLLQTGLGSLVAYLAAHMLLACCQPSLSPALSPH